MLKAANIHDLAREYLSKDGLTLKDTQKKAVFEFADWVLQKPTHPGAPCNCTLHPSAATVHADDCPARR